jgi:hypothetical protein
MRRTAVESFFRRVDVFQYVRSETVGDLTYSDILSVHHVSR